MKILATLCYLRKDRQTLMLHRVKKVNDIHQGKWNGMGGKVEDGESPEECAIREVKEESGLDILKQRFAGIITFPLFDGENDWYVYLFEVTSFSGEIIECDEGNLEWIDDNNIFNLPLWEGDHYFLRWLLGGKFFSAKFIYKNKKLSDHTVEFY
ncbi:MAG: 8-oxo-dGTP diphosphatase [Candidatus Zophobacter franzmannii]|nr:8-oxo-dGTP diphosphatase [Candidatus Zophobacter franzmannii]